MTDTIRTCENCRHWFYNEDFEASHGAYVGKCTKAHEPSERSFCCGGWETQTFKIKVIREGEE